MGRKLTEYTANKLKNNHFNNVVNHGFSVQNVSENEESASFAYTIGLAQKGFPELLAFGLPGATAIHLFTSIYRMLTRKQAEGDGLLLVNMEGVLIDSIATLPVYLREITVTGRVIEYTKIAEEMHRTHFKYCGHPYRVAMIIWPDPEGKFPWDEGFNEKYAEHQPPLWK